MLITTLFFFSTGLIVGSFLNVCIYRLPRGESIVFPASHCPLCQAKLGPADLVPVLSYFLLDGKCRYCGQSVSWRYPVVEIVNAVGWVLLAYRYGISSTSIFGMLLFSLLFLITVIDLEHMIIPDSLVICLFLIGIIYHFSAQDLSWVNRFLGLLTGFVIPLILAIASKGGMGGGDVKFIAVMGFWLGFPGIFYALFFGALAGSVLGLTLIAFKRRTRKDPLPFGPFLAVGFFLVFLFDKLTHYSTSFFWG